MRGWATLGLLGVVLLCAQLHADTCTARERVCKRGVLRDIHGCCVEVTTRRPKVPVVKVGAPEWKQSAKKVYEFSGDDIEVAIDRPRNELIPAPTWKAAASSSTIAGLRAELARAKKKKEDRASHGYALAGMLYQKSAPRSDERIEARDLLRKLVPEGSELVLAQLALVEFDLQSDDRAAALYDQLALQFPSPQYLFRQAFFRFRAGKLDDAAKVTYFKAWREFTQGNPNTAKLTLLEAAREPGAPMRQMIRDYQLFAAFSDDNPDTAMTALSLLAERAKVAVTPTLMGLGEVYRSLGRADEAIAVYQAIANNSKPEVAVEAYYAAYPLALESLGISAAARYLDSTVDAMKTVGASFPAERREDIRASVLELAKLAHVTFDKTLDDAPGDAAVFLYALYLTLASGTVEPELMDYIENLAEIRQRARDARARKGGPTGTLDKNVIRRSIRFHRGQLDACYRRALLADATLSGTLQLHLVIDPAKGEFSSVKASGMPALASCVTDAAKSWRLPIVVHPAELRIEIAFPLEFHLAG